MNKIIKLIAVILMLLVIYNLPYGYYEFLRIVITGISGYLAFKYFDKKIIGWSVTMTGIAILFNPVLPIHLDKSIWVFINIILAIVFIISIYKK